MNSSFGRQGGMDRRSFLGGAVCAVSAVAAGCLSTRTVGPEEDWKAVFLDMGFDPDAPGCGVFSVVGDPHVTDGINAPFADAVRFWNAMSPRPKFALSVGDQLCHVSLQFGDRETPAKPGWQAETDRECAILHGIVDRLEIPFKHVIGNHDTYPEEVDAKEYARHFPGWRPYERMDVCGVQFLLLNAGHDGWFDPAQEDWMREQLKTLDPKRALVLVAHQPTMSRHRENGVPRTIRKIFGDWTGEFWFLGGHEHINRLERYHLPNGNMLGVATHARAFAGFWLYGISNGRIVARLFVEAKGSGKDPFSRGRTFAGWLAPERGKMPSEMEDKGLLPIPFENTPGVLWKVFVGEDDDKRLYHVEHDPQTDAGHWYFYIGRTTYRLPLRSKAPGATHVAFLGNLLHHRKTHEPEPVWISNDGKNWSRCPDIDGVECVYAYEIPERMRGAEWIYLRVDGFGFGCDSCIAGYALLK